ncbi:extracellular medium-chain-length polyhydroxyalkanoate depolymerase [Ectopseudomonas oleovorans]|uniref:extracellular medium-chain-length polyhydroxyalkanoate depolymerase n=1 Tax=Ectopseudomonas oleovorans TaxID=301 RepID=UPI00244994D2|nr:alpha/beta hydrolase-fold protein [Pseudomonas oleovorans]MDG9978992.1 alpha/beta hydrolase-fold protein [Pseudomonas oleovorans]
MSTVRRVHRFTAPLLVCAALAGAPAMAASLCSEQAQTASAPATVSCSSKALQIDSGSAGQRRVVYQVPSGTPPAGGWPVVLLYHGSLTKVSNFVYNSDMPFGGYYQGKLVQGLLDHGYAVLAPNALTAAEAWETNADAFANNYSQSNDYLFFNNLFASIAKGSFGPLNSQRQYAAGISSGGYNSSRMAVSFPGKFRALAIQSASYASCVGARCTLPATLPANHPPTLFVHGMADRVVPWSSMQPYHDRLLYQGIDTALYSEPSGAHQWFAASPGQILDWFTRHP